MGTQVNVYKIVKFETEEIEVNPKQFFLCKSSSLRYFANGLVNLAEIKSLLNCVNKIFHG